MLSPGIFPTQESNRSLLHCRRILLFNLIQYTGDIQLFHEKGSDAGAYFFKGFFFNLMWTILKVFTEFVVVLLLFYVLVFWPRGVWYLSSPSGDGTHAACIGRRSLNHRTTREALHTFDCGTKSLKFTSQVSRVLFIFSSLLSDLCFPAHNGSPYFMVEMLLERRSPILVCRTTRCLFYFSWRCHWTGINYRAPVLRQRECRIFLALF